MLNIKTFKILGHVFYISLHFILSDLANKKDFMLKRSHSASTKFFAKIVVTFIQRNTFSSKFRAIKPWVYQVKIVYASNYYFYGIRLSIIYFN